MSAQDLRVAMQRWHRVRVAESEVSGGFLELPEEDWESLYVIGRAVAAALGDDWLETVEQLCSDWFALRRVYFIAAESPYVKIGVASSPANRISSIQTGHYAELRTLVLVPGSNTLERRFHERFAAQHERREWFRREGDLEEFLGTVAPAFWWPVRAREEAA